MRPAALFLYKGQQPFSCKKAVVRCSNEECNRECKDGLSQNQAAELHGVPCSTLKDRHHGRVIHGTNPDPQPYLSSSEESELAAFLVDAAKMGYGPPVDISSPLASSLSGSPMDVSGPLVSNPSGPLMCSTCPPLSFSSPLMSLSGPPTSSPSGLSMNVSGPMVSSPSGPLVNLSDPPMSSPSALNVSSALASSSSGPQQLVHIPLSPCLSSNLPSRNCSPLSNLLNLPVQSEITWKTGKPRVLTSAECVQALKDKERKKQEETEQ